MINEILRLPDPKIQIERLSNVINELLRNNLQNPQFLVQELKTISSTLFTQEVNQQVKISYVPTSFI